MGIKLNTRINNIIFILSVLFMLNVGLVLGTTTTDISSQGFTLHDDFTTLNSSIWYVDSPAYHTGSSIFSPNDVGTYGGIVLNDSTFTISPKDEWNFTTLIRAGASTNNNLFSWTSVGNESDTVEPGDYVRHWFRNRPTNSHSVGRRGSIDGVLLFDQTGTISGRFVGTTQINMTTQKYNNDNDTYQMITYFNGAVIYNSSVGWNQSDLPKEDWHFSWLSRGESLSSIYLDDVTISVNYDIQDNIAPNITLTSPENNTIIYGKTITFEWNSTDNIDNNPSCDLYIDGVLETSNILGTLDEYNTEISFIGNAGYHTWSVNCTDDYSNTNSSEKRTILVLSPTILPFDATELNSSLTYVYSLDGHGNELISGVKNMTENNTPTELTSTNCMHNTCFDFESDNNEYFETTYNLFDVNTHSYTVSAWVKHESLTASQGLLVQGQHVGDSNNQLRLQYTSSLNAYTNSFATDWGYYNYNLGGDIVTDTWYNIIATYNVSVGASTGLTVTEIYINNVLNTTSTLTTYENYLDETDQYTSIGRSARSATFPFDGIIDEVYVWEDKILNTTEREFIYGYGNPSTASFYPMESTTIPLSEPVIVSVTLDKSSYATNEDILGNCTALDYDNSTYTYYYTWYNGTTPEVTGSQSSQYINLSSTYTTLGDNWTLECLVNNGYANSTPLNSSLVLINETPTTTIVNYYVGGWSLYDTFTYLNTSIWKLDSPVYNVTGSLYNPGGSGVLGGVILNDSNFSLDPKAEWNITSITRAGDVNESNLYSFISLGNESDTVEPGDYIRHWFSNRPGSLSSWGRHDSINGTLLSSQTGNISGFMNTTPTMHLYKKYNNPNGTYQMEIYKDGVLKHNSSYGYNITDFPDEQWYFSWLARGETSSTVYLDEINISVKEYVPIPNTAPVIQDIYILPDSPVSYDDLVSYVNTTDINLDLIKYEYIWYENGTVIFSNDSLYFTQNENNQVSILSSDNTTLETEYIFSARAYDGENYSDWVNSTPVTTTNIPPSIINVSIIPDPAGTNDNLTANCTGNDSNTGDVLTYEYEWFVNNVSTSNDINLSSGIFTQNDEIILSCRVYDQIVYSDWENSTTLIISNSIPITNSSTIDQAVAYTNDNLTGNCTGIDSDTDDILTYEYEWFVENVSVATTQYLGSGNFTNFEEVIFSCRVFDQYDYGDWLNSTPLTISNSLPVTTTSSIDQAVAYTNDTLTATCTGTDLDSVDVLTYEYEWFVNNVSTGTTQSLTDTNFENFDDVNVACRVYDQTGYGSWVNSTVLTISNSLPIIQIPTIAPVNAYTDTQLTATCVADDEDSNDILLYNYTWFVDGVDVGATDQNTLDTSYYIHFQNVTVQCIASDSYMFSAPLNSTEKVILNRIPTIDTIGITGQYPEQNLSGICSSSDIDLDGLTEEYEWFVNNISTGVTTVNITNEYYNISDEVLFRCRATDTYNYSDWDNTTTIIINHGVVGYSNIVDDSDANTQIGSTVEFDADVVLYDNVSVCTLYLQPSTSPTPFDNVTMSTTGVTNVHVNANFTIPFKYTSDYDNITWFITCNDTSGNSGTSSISNFTIGDYTPPEVNINTSVSPILVNGTVVDNVVNGVINITTTFSDLNLFQASVNVSCVDSGDVYYWENLSINATEYNFTDLVDLTGLGPQRCDITLSSSDDHTANKIPDYAHNIIDDSLIYNTENGLEVKITSTDSTKKIKTKKIKDRYNFEFDYDDSSLIRKYTLETDGIVYVRDESKYPGHFVIWNEETHTGNWIDFALPNSEDFIYITNKINDHTYEVVVAHKSLVNPDDTNYKKKKKTNIITEIVDWFVGTQALDENKIKKTIKKQFKLNRKLTDKEIEDAIGIKVKNKNNLEILEVNYGIDNVEFNSIGGTNIVEVQTYFYIGGVFNITTNNQYDDTSFTGYTVRVEKTDAPTSLNIYYFNTTSQNYIENVSAGDYTVTISHPLYASETFIKTMETQYDECIQEQANESTACGGLDTGNYAFSDINDFINHSNMFDGDNYTFASVSSFNMTYLYANYTIPDNTTFAAWTVTAFGVSRNVEIPLDTFNKTVLELRIEAEDAYGNNHINLQEYNGTDWIDLTYTPLQIYDSKIFEEKMTWFTQIENKIDLVYNTSQAVITFVHRNIKSGDTINNYTFTIDDGIISTEYNITDGSVGITLPLNANVSYTTTINKEGFNEQNFTYVFEYGERATYTEFLTYNAYINFLDEATYDPFDFSDPTSAFMLVKCNDETTYSYSLDNTTLITNTSSFEFEVVCNYTNFRFILTYAGGTSYYRTLIVGYEDSLNATFYLIDLSTTPFVYGSFIIDDLFGSYENPSIYIKKSIPGGTVDIQSDYTDIENKVGYYLIENNEYIVEVHSDNNPIQVIGKYSADVGGEKVISLYGINLDSDPTGISNDAQYTINIINNSGEQQMLFNYYDEENLTESIQFRIYTDSVNGTLIYESPVYTNVNELGDFYVPILGYENRTLIGVIEIYHDDVGTVNIKKKVNKDWGISLGIEEYVSQEFLNWFFLILLSVIAIQASIKTSLASLVVVGIGFIFVLFGWFQLSIYIVSFVILVAIIDALANRKTGVR